MLYQDYLKQQWSQYLRDYPSLKKIIDLIEKEEGSTIINDHIAFRTFQDPSIGMEQFIRFFEQMGLKVCGDYSFEKKKLRAVHLENPANPSDPKIFVSELLWSQLPDSSQNIVRSLLDQIDRKKDFSELLGGTVKWTISSEDYDLLSETSEYAGWLSYMGLRPNHFTISINHLRKLNTIAKMNDFLIKHGSKLNENGGAIKGSEEDLLMQSSTMAVKKNVSFDGGERLLSSCYLEFAQRFLDSNNKLYQGFIPSSADKIFESTYES